MSGFTEGDQVVFEGIAADDGLAPGDTGTIVAMTGSGAWVQWHTGALASAMRLVWLDDLEEHDANADTENTAAAAGG